MRDIMDLHTHTIASGHAYSTVGEMIAAAKEKGLEILGITEHAPNMPGTCPEMYFMNLKVMPRERYGVKVLFGAELNIMDADGTVDLPEYVLKRLDYAIASLHLPCYPGGTKEENTRAYLNAMKNPYVKIIGHPDDGRYPADFDALAKAAKEHGVLLEVNGSSLQPDCFRENSRENYQEMLKACMKYETSVIIDSDAHVDVHVGRHDAAIALLSEMDFPERLVVNTDAERLKEFIRI
ncbi:MAG: phosphatase [Roseburia sp.]|jgi:putative hydrolase|nr:phosphatase [Roseburia sp.]